jgi:hypothetical protein
VEIEPALRRYLLDVPEVRGIVGPAGVHKQKLYEPVSGKGKRAVVVRANSGGWSIPNQINTQEFPLLALDFWADKSRDSGGKEAADDCADNARAVYRVVDKLLHGLRGRYVGGMGGNPGLYVVTCDRWSEPVTATEDDTKTWPAYNMDLGDAAVVSVQYALTVFH